MESEISGNWPVKDELERISSSCSSVAAVAKVADAFRGSESIQDPAQVCPEFIDGALFRTTDQVLELGEGIFNRIEIRAVWGQEHHPSTGRLDRIPGLNSFVTGQVIQNDD